MRDWLSDGSSVLVASEPTTSTDSDFLGIVSDTLFSGEDLHTRASGQKLGEAGRKRDGPHGHILISQIASGHTGGIQR